MSAKRRQWVGRIYLGRDANGKQVFFWCGRFPTRRDRDAAVAKARTERPWERKAAASMTCNEWADRYIARYERMAQKGERKASSIPTIRSALKPFRATFGPRTVASIEPVEAEDWVQTVTRAAVPQAVAMFNYAVRMRVIPHSPFQGLSGGRAPGRSLQDPPTESEMERLLDACAALGEYGPQMRALIVVAAYTGMRPGELFELRWSDIDLTANRITVSRRLYRGQVDLPKSGKAKRIALPPPARDVLLRQPTRSGDLVFVSKRGRRFTHTTLTDYWAQVRRQAGLPDVAFYLATKHWGVHLLYRLGLSRRAIGAQMGWSEKAVDQLLEVYGHQDLVALAEVDALYAVRPAWEREKT